MKKDNYSKINQIKTLKSIIRKKQKEIQFQILERKKNSNQFINTQKDLLKFFFELGEESIKYNKKQKIFFQKEIKKSSKQNRFFFNIAKEALIGIDDNKVNLYGDIRNFVRKEKYFSSMFVLRGLMEIIIFDVFITFKAFYHIQKNNINELVNLLCKSNFGLDYSSYKHENLATNADFKKLLMKYRGKRIHINDCLSYFKKQNWINILTKDYSRNSIFKNFDLKNKFQISDLVMHLINKTNKPSRRFTGLDYLYYKLCEIIHPTAIMLHNHKDPIVKEDFLNLITGILNTQIILVDIAASKFRPLIFQWMILNEKEVTKEYKKLLI